MIYLDNSATTPMHESVVDVMATVQKQYIGNPSSLHQLGVKAHELLTKARVQMATLLNVQSDELFFTSGGTESNNTAILSTVFQKNKKHVITSRVEHPSVLKTMAFLEKLGYRVTYLPVNKEGIITIDDLQNALCDETCLVSLMWVNNEVGAKMPIESVAQLLENYPTVHFHVDAVQALDDVLQYGIPNRVDLLSLSAHKFHGPRGVGVLYKKRGKVITPYLNGGGQESGLRSGTENVAGIVATSRALREYVEKHNSCHTLFEQLHTTLMAQLQSFENVVILSPTNSAKHILTVAVPGVRGEVMVHALEQHGVFVSTTSACSSKVKGNHHTLGAMHVAPSIATCAVRISFSKWTTLDDVHQFGKIFKTVYTQFEKVMQ